MMNLKKILILLKNNKNDDIKTINNCENVLSNYTIQLTMNSFTNSYSLLSRCKELLRKIENRRSENISKSINKMKEKNPDLAKDLLNTLKFG